VCQQKNFPPVSKFEKKASISLSKEVFLTALTGVLFAAATALRADRFLQG